uniref:Uncharacterized protein n=1 Tax=Hyaloperonospora arabidopsidis (strain Emoy2) TaxID=559515 RepID=M4BS29_HYAAE
MASIRYITYIACTDLMGKSERGVSMRKEQSPRIWMEVFLERKSHDCLGGQAGFVSQSFRLDLLQLLLLDRGRVDVRASKWL